MSFDSDRTVIAAHQALDDAGIPNDDGDRKMSLLERIGYVLSKLAEYRDKARQP